jgi:hypothetical protein
MSISSPKGYEDIKALAERLDRPMSSLIVLAAQNDPFYAGVAYRRHDAEWFASVWNEFEFVRDELAAQTPDIDAYDWPGPEDAHEDDDPLYDSTRDYVEQVDRFKRHQGKPTTRKESALTRRRVP